MNPIQIAGQILLVVILVRPLRNRTLAKYSLFYAYVAFVLLVSLVRTVVLLMSGASSVEYHLAYKLPAYPMALLQILVLLDLCRRVMEDRQRKPRPWIRLTLIATALTAPVAGVLLTQYQWNVFERYQAVTLFLQMALCVLICREVVRAREQIDLGQNLKGILSGMSLLVGAQALNFLGFALGELSFQVFEFFVPFIYLTALIVFTYALWDYAPLTRLDPAYPRRLDKAERDLREALRSVFPNRK